MSPSNAVRRRVIIISTAMSLGIIIAIMSLPIAMESVAKYLVDTLGGVVLMAIFIAGVLHGLKPDEHTWPITIPYALSQRSLTKGLLSTYVFTGTLTLIWTILSIITSTLKSIAVSSNVEPYADIAAGITMLGVGLFFSTRRSHDAPSFRHIWLHGVAAAFGGDFFVVLALTLILSGNAFPAHLGFLVGLLFGLGSMLSQSIVVSLAYKGVKAFVSNTEIMRMSGVYSLMILGIFLVILGMLIAMGALPQD